VYVILLMKLNCCVAQFCIFGAERNSLIMEREYIICLMNMRLFAHLFVSLKIGHAKLPFALCFILGNQIFLKEKELIRKGAISGQLHALK